MKKLSTLLPITIIVIVLGYFIFKVVDGYLNTCNTMAKETTSGLTASMKIVKANASFALDEKKLNEVSDKTESLAYGIKSCCIGGTRGLFKEDESYTKCLKEANEYNLKLQSAGNYLELAEAANMNGDTQAAQLNAQKANAVLGYTYQLERAYNNAADVMSDIADQISGENQ